MNPTMLLQTKQRLDVFNKEHPKMGAFLKTVKEKALAEGAVIEIKVTGTDGQEYVSNIKMTRNDLKTIEMFTDNV